MFLYGGVVRLFTGIAPINTSIHALSKGYTCTFRHMDSLKIDVHGALHMHMEHWIPYLSLIHTLGICLYILQSCRSLPIFPFYV